MSSVFGFLDPLYWAFALGIAFCAGFVKGVVGFAQPLVMISGLTLFLSPELALAGLILPTLVANGVQSLRQGVGAAWSSVRSFRYFMMVGGITMVITAQLVLIVPQAVLLLVIGIPALIYSLLELSGVSFSMSQRRKDVDMGVGAVAGAMGGMAGVWGPPTVMYLTALNTPKHDQMRVQGVIYGTGSIVLVVAHVGSGVLTMTTVWFSVSLILPALLGMWVGGQVVDRIDQAAFKRATLIVLLIAGANLIRRALF